eukprot:3352341-Amphidinium_carterae.1
MASIGGRSRGIEWSKLALHVLLLGRCMPIAGEQEEEEGHAQHDEANDCSGAEDEADDREVISKG